MQLTTSRFGLENTDGRKVVWNVSGAGFLLVLCHSECTLSLWRAFYRTSNAGLWVSQNLIHPLLTKPCTLSWGCIDWAKEKLFLGWMALCRGQALYPEGKFTQIMCGFYCFHLEIVPFFLNHASMTQWSWLSQTTPVTQQCALPKGKKAATQKAREK